MDKKYVSNTKEQRIKDAESWLNTLSNNDKYGKAIEQANQYVYYYTEEMARLKGLDVPYENRFNDTVIRVFNNDVAICTKAAITHAKKESKVCVLNFASYYNPGGGFLKGALSQEESICRMSGLYPVLNSIRGVYDSRKNDKSVGPLYKDDFVYCCDIPFIINGKGDLYKADVLSISAPNIKAANDNPKFMNMSSYDIIKRRMEIAFTVPYLSGCDTILLGAFGCGVFGNDVEYVAKYWNYLTKDKYKGMYREVIHPVFDKVQCKVFIFTCL